MARKEKTAIDQAAEKDLQDISKQAQKLQDQATQRANVYHQNNPGIAGPHTHGNAFFANTASSGHYTNISAVPGTTSASPVYPTQWTTAPATPGFVTYGQQYPPMTVQQQIFTDPRYEEMSPEDREMAIEFVENLMFLLVARLDECDVHNEGGIMDRNEYAPIESVIDLGEYEIVIRPKT